MKKEIDEKNSILLLKNDELNKELNENKNEIKEKINDISKLKEQIQTLKDEKLNFDTIKSNLEKKIDELNSRNKRRT